MMQRVAAVVLAAGGSCRLGRPKQLVVYEGRPLVARAARAALAAGTDPVGVVLGANARAVRASLAGIPVIPVFNPEWDRGMDTSVAVAVRAIVEHTPSVDGVLIMLADQPLVRDAALLRLLEAWADSPACSIAAAEYGGTVGVPAVFGRAHFDALCSLTAAAGAAPLLRQPDAPVRRVAMSEAALDVDTPEDLERLRDGSDDSPMILSDVAKVNAGA